MLATPELIAAAAQPGRLAEVLPRYRKEVPLYGEVLPNHGSRALPPGDHWHRLPLITKADIRRNFPHNFLGQGRDLEDLLDRDQYFGHNPTGSE